MHTDSEPSRAIMIKCIPNPDRSRVLSGRVRVREVREDLYITPHSRRLLQAVLVK